MRPVSWARASATRRERLRMRGTKPRSIASQPMNQTSIGQARRASARASSATALDPYTRMYQTALTELTTLSRNAGPVCSTRLARRPAKSFWKNIQLWRTTCQ